MRKLLLLSLYLCFFYGLQAQTWDGDAGDNNWNNPLNWDTDMVPLAGALVEFTQTVTVTSTGAVVPPAQILVRGAGTILTLDLNITVGDGVIPEHALIIRANTQVIIPSGRTVVLNAPPTEHGIANFSGAGNARMTVDAGGAIDIISCERGINLQNSTFVFTNNGSIGITIPDRDGINLGIGATFNNHGTIAIAGAGQDGIDNSGNFNNTGTILLNTASRNCILNGTNGTFNNNGLIDISDLLLITDDGIFTTGTFNNQVDGIITVGRMTDDAVDALDGTFTNDGEMYLTVKNTALTENVGLSIGSNTVANDFINNGIIDIDGGVSATGTAVYIFSGSSMEDATLTNNGFITIRNGNPDILFFTKGVTLNGPTGTINTGNGRINVDLGTFQNNGLIESNYPMAPGVFTNLTGNSVNDGFFRTNSSLFSNGTGVIMDNGINMNDPAQTTFDLGGGCDVTIGGPGAGQLWENTSGTIVAGPGPDLSFMDAFPAITSATINASGIDVSLTLTNLCAAALPIELTSFTATPKEKSVMLNWETAGEINNDYMAVERSGDAREFTEIGKIAGAGNSNTSLRYELEDTAPLNGVNYYRLRQVDYDGTVNYSNIISVNFDGKIGLPPAVALYPNVVKTGGSMTVDLRNFPQQPMTFRILNSRGQIINNVSLVGGARHSFEPGNLPAGIYFLIDTSSATKTSTKFVVLD